MTVFKNKSLLAFLMLVTVTSSVQAADTTITVSGKVVAAACTVESGLINGQTVDLGVFGRTKLQAPGTAGDWRSFSLKLTNCPPGTNKSTVTFSGTPDSHNAELFANTEPLASAAANVAVQIAKDSDRSAVLSNNSMMTVDVDGARNATFPLAARLYTPLGNTQAGNVASIVLVNFTYQ
ncbi:MULTISPECIES: fimbrial protein [unclassified Serratia (in: enterobacteria)]|uniref:fimbrial protein n=1 Tax=unclassified Serratia (in: enterobacteria) TaxID=2647522 RepID=UPI003076177B